MNSFQHLTAQLAAQVDRALLHTEDDADYYRMDISAHETLQLLPYAKPLQMPSVGILRLPVQDLKRFAVAAAAIYMLLFSVTNAAAYGKILVADIQAAAAQQPVALRAPVMEFDVLTGERSIAHITKERELVALEEASLQPENGILPLDLTPSHYDNRLVIPAIDVNAPIVEPEFGVEALTSSDWNVLEETIHESLQNGVVHYPGTADAGEKGNFFLTGHSSNVFWEASEYNTVFALLPRLEVGDDIFVTIDQQEFHYQVTEKREVSPKDVSVLQQGDQRGMTLMTCTPVGTTLRRLVVSAQLID